ncbi:MAG: bifunctional 4-hydroxy-2-oxoglutarate aldolase/2-dehydro-3-deoxy-phosphogluconate aldolase [Rhodoglobus sp.]
MSLTRDFVTQNPIVPVIVIDDAGQVGDLVAALASGGINCAEITLRTPAGLAAIAAVSGGDFAVGAGTVLSLDELKATIDAGATFVVCPGFDEAIVEHALDQGIGILPGIATATEVQRAVRAGLDTVKFFPADRLGGLGTIAALAAPFVGMGFVPSGGVDATNAPEYLRHVAVPAVSGSWMASRAMIRSGDFAAIEAASRAVSTAVAAR